MVTSAIYQALHITPRRDGEAPIDVIAECSSTSGEPGALREHAAHGRMVRARRRSTRGPDHGAGRTGDPRRVLNVIGEPSTSSAP